jgi:hypothetical protein
MQAVGPQRGRRESSADARHMDKARLDACFVNTAGPPTHATAAGAPVVQKHGEIDRRHQGAKDGEMISGDRRTRRKLCSSRGQLSKGIHQRALDDVQRKEATAAAMTA